ncbi:MAG: hypothetical protein HY717_06745, partial [Planctomycetes bacterium]|nr:hypothetical protein [Planctomycetota bacterium]
MCACHESPTETCAAEKSAGKNAATPPLDNPPAVTAEQLHIILLKAFKVGNLARRKFLQALLAMDSSRLYLQLGFSSI